MKAKEIVEKIENEKLNEETVKKLYDTLVELSKGISYEKPSLTGVVKIYKEKPSEEALKYLLDRAGGKPSQKIMGPGDNGEFKMEIVKYVEKL